MMLGFIVDSLILVLLLALLAFGISLRRRIAGIRGTGGELQELINALDHATMRAEAVLGDFRRSAAESGTMLAGERERLIGLRDDLRMLSERAEHEADRLAEMIGAARDLPARPAFTGGGRDLPPDLEQDQNELERRLRSLR